MHPHASGNGQTRAQSPHVCVCDYTSLMSAWGLSGGLVNTGVIHVPCPPTLRMHDTALARKEGDVSGVVSPILSPPPTLHTAS